MHYLEVALVIAAFLCALVAGFLFAFAVVVMPGIKRLTDRGFIEAFQVMDGIIQEGQPVFTAVWVGSAVALVVAAAFGLGHGDAAGRWLLVIAAVAYLLGVQLPTFVVNIPLNNRLQSMDLEAADAAEQATARAVFEARWNRWNAVRTVVASAVVLLLIGLLLRY
jgi:uncharacterized membrane protein